MTAQISEKLLYQGQERAMCTEPLGDYFALGGERPTFADTSTALWRRYVGTWEIINDRLYLVKLSGTLEDGAEATLENVFPGYPDRVFAHWYSGTLRIPDGKRLEYVHMGYASRYERDILITIQRGMVVASMTRHNGQSDDQNSPEGYGIAAMTVFPVRGGGKDGQ